MAYRFPPKRRNQVSGETAYGAPSRSSAILKSSWIFVLAMLLFAADLHAQNSTVIGTITYSSGKPAVNVLVSVGSQYRYTDVGGRYKVDDVPAGVQTMAVKSGQKILWQGSVNISRGITTVNRILP
jgi:hypothetical protein